jgi:type I restriction enzyme S subunit
MQKLLTGELRLQGYKGEWKKYELEELMSPTSEKFNPQTSERDQKCVELEHLQKEDSKLLGYVNSGEQKSIKNIFHPGDILFGKLRPYLRKFLLPDFQGVCSTEIWVLKTTKKLNNLYAYHLVQAEKFLSVANISSGTHMPRADWKYMKGVSFTIPEDLKEQEAIANILQSADAEVNSLSKQLEYFQQQKKYLLNNLVTGQIRTPENL